MESIAGYAAGQHYAETNMRGGHANMLCLPTDPELSNITSKPHDSFVNGTEYEENILKAGAHNEDVPCAIAKVEYNGIYYDARKKNLLSWMEEGIFWFLSI